MAFALSTAWRALVSGSMGRCACSYVYNGPSTMFGQEDVRLGALAGDVVEMVDGVVDEVAGEGLDGEAGPVAAPTGPLPLACGHAGEPAGDGLCGLGQRGGDHGGILLGVAFGYGGRVLVPVREQRVVPAEHQLEPLVVKPEHV